MTQATPDNEFTAMFREYVDRMRAKLTNRLGDIDQSAVERGLSSLLAAGATILLLLGGGKARDGLLGAVLAAAAKYLAKHEAERNHG